MFHSQVEELAPDTQNIHFILFGLFLQYGQFLFQESFFLPEDVEFIINHARTHGICELSVSSGHFTHDEVERETVQVLYLVSAVVRLHVSQHTAEFLYILHRGCITQNTQRIVALHPLPVFHEESVYDSRLSHRYPCCF